MNLTADAATLAAAERPVADFLASLPAAAASEGPCDWLASELLLPPGSEALTVPTQVRGAAV